MTWWKFWESDSIDDEDGCTAHHFDDYEVYEYTIGETTPFTTGRVCADYNGGGELEHTQVDYYEDMVEFLKVTAQKRSKCEHKGCFAEDKKRTVVGYVKAEDFDEMYYNEIPEHEDEL